MDNLKKDEWKTSKNFLMFPLRLIEPELNPQRILLSAARHWGANMNFHLRSKLKDEYIEENYIDKYQRQKWTEDSEFTAAGLQGFDFKSTSENPSYGLKDGHFKNTDTIIRLRQDYFDSWYKNHWSDKLFTTLCAIISKVGAKPFCPVSWQEVAARQVGSTDHLDSISHQTLTRQEVRTVVNQILEKGLLSRVVFKKRISYYSVRLRKDELKEAILKYKTEGAKRKGLNFDMSANHFNSNQPL
ncbi:hypothetical protein N8603_00855 [Verrucomicrobiales bacterium]|nr:hypothetical protein [Verrucomicrobiales bacterium]